MADKMMRVASRGEDGLAKPFQSDNQGKLKINVKEDMSGRLAYQTDKIKKLDIPTYDGSNQLVHPSVVYIATGFAGYAYWMAFTPFPNSDFTKENPSVVASHDGENWVVPAGLTNPIAPAPAQGWYADTSIVYDGTKLIVYWAHLGGNGSISKTYRSTSTDGITWSAPVECTGSGGGLLPDAGIVRVREGNWHSWFTRGYRTNNQDINSDWQHYISKDGLAWTTGRPTFHNLASEHMLHAVTTFSGGIFHHVVSTKLGSHGVEAALFYGQSKDGLNIYFDQTPLLVPQDWANLRIYTGQIVFDNKGVWLYFSSNDTTNKWYVGRVPIKINSLLPAPSLTSNTRQRMIFDDYQIRDTNAHFAGGGTGVPLVEFNVFKHKIIHVKNTHNQPITMRVLASIPNNEKQQIKNPNVEGLPVLSYTIPTEAFGAFISIDEDLIKVLGQKLPYPVYLDFKATTAPTSGSLNLIMSAYD